MDSAHIKAVETRLKWLRWAKDTAPYKYPELATIINHQYVPVLEKADTFYMNRQFAELVDNARETIPDDLVFDSTWMQSRMGWLYTAHPFLVPHIIEPEGLPTLDMRINAIGWYPVPEGAMTGLGTTSRPSGNRAGKGAYEFVCFLDNTQFAEGLDPERSGFGCWSYFMLQDGDKLIDRIHDFEFNGAGMHEGEGGGNYPQVRKTDMLHEIRWVYAAFYLMAQRLTMHVQHNTERAVRRRAEREYKLPIPPIYRVITLRRMEEAKQKAKEEGKSEIEWSWQWMVRGHWRNQWFASEGVHKPVFIESYIKGPEDKPLKPETHKLFIAQR